MCHWETECWPWSGDQSRVATEAVSLCQDYKRRHKPDQVCLWCRWQACLPLHHRHERVDTSWWRSQIFDSGPRSKRSHLGKAPRSPRTWPSPRRFGTRWTCVGIRICSRQRPELTWSRAWYTGHQCKCLERKVVIRLTKPLISRVTIANATLIRRQVTRRSLQSLTNVDISVKVGAEAL